MVLVSFKLKENYWDEFYLENKDVEFLYNHLLEVETPLTPEELIKVLVAERIQREKQEIEEQRLAGAEVYIPKDKYEVGNTLVFPAFNWRRGEVRDVRPGWNPDLGEFAVIKVEFDDGEVHELAAELEDHSLNEPPESSEEQVPDVQAVLENYEDLLVEKLEQGLDENPDFVRIAGRWFPRALLVEVNAGHLNLAEAVLDMAGGGPLPTSDLVSEVDLPTDENPKLVEFSWDLALQEDHRFDEVGPAGQVLWYLQRLEPEGVRETPLQLRYNEIDYDPEILTPAMQGLERQLDDELSPPHKEDLSVDEVTIQLLFPHLRAGTLPLTPRVRPLFPTAYEAPRIRFILVDGVTGEKFPGWVVRERGYIFGLAEWYEKRGLIPGSIIRVRKGKHPGEVIVEADTKRSRRDWVRTVLVGSDGGIVFAMLKQVITAAYDERMAIVIPDVKLLDDVWEQRQKKQPPFERTVVDIVRELTKLNPQNHVHAAELYAAVNLVRRCPPGPILALLTSRPWFVHVGDLHFRFDDSEGK